MKNIRKSIHTETISWGKIILRITRHCYPADSIVKMSLQNVEKLNSIYLFNYFNFRKHIFYKALSLLYCDHIPMTRRIRQEAVSVKENSPAKKICINFTNIQTLTGQLWKLLSEYWLSGWRLSSWKQDTGSNKVESNRERSTGEIQYHLS